MSSLILSFHSLYSIGLNRSMAPHCQLSQRYHSQMYTITLREKNMLTRHATVTINSRHGTVYGDQSDKRQQVISQLIPGTRIFQIVSFLEPAADLGFPCNKVLSLAFQSTSSVGRKRWAKPWGCLQVCRPPYPHYSGYTHQDCTHFCGLRMGSS